MPTYQQHVVIFIDCIDYYDVIETFTVKSIINKKFIQIINLGNHATQHVFCFIYPMYSLCFGGGTIIHMVKIPSQLMYSFCICRCILFKVMWTVSVLHYKLKAR